MKLNDKHLTALNKIMYGSDTYNDDQNNIISFYTRRWVRNYGQKMTTDVLQTIIKAADTNALLFLTHGEGYTFFLEWATENSVISELAFKSVLTKKSVRYTSPHALLDSVYHRAASMLVDEVVEFLMGEVSLFE